MTDWRARTATRALLALLLVSAIGLLPPLARAEGPVIAGYWPVPKYPIAYENVSINASVSDPDGVARVDLVWCYFPPGLCSPPTPMADDDGDGVWGYTIGLYPAGTKMYYNVTAEDELGDINGTAEKWLAIVSEIDVLPETTGLAAAPGETVGLNATSIYDGNASLPVEFQEASLIVEETSEAWSTTTDASGVSSFFFTAPAAEGLYHLRLYVNHTADTFFGEVTLTGMANVTLSVSAVPLPDLAVLNVQASDTAIEGQQFSVVVTLGNLGAAVAASTTAALYPEGSPNDAVTTVLASLPVGETQQASFDWTAIRGSHVLVVQLDPDNAVLEMDESNNVASIDVHVDPDTDGDGIRDSDDFDDDGDGMPDAWEEEWACDPLLDDAAQDYDGDGLSNIEEYETGTDPHDKDTDGDGYTDLAETEAGTDPTSYLDSPRNAQWLSFILVIVIGATVGDALVLVWYRMRHRR